MSSVPVAIAEILSSVRRPGDYYVSGRVEMFAPGLEVEGVGPVALPLLPMQARELVAVAETAPYGRGEDTIIDPAVRRTWQIGADRIRMRGRHWPSTLAGIVERAAEGLGVTESVTAELYKLLIYDQGCFFASHRDTEKAPGMFATLVVVLPSVHEGGGLIIRHQGREVRVDLAGDASEVAFAAFYADCRHEVLPVVSGCRLALIYNLLRRGRGARLQPPDHGAETAALARVLRSWCDDATAPLKLVYPLEHGYSAADLGFDRLKGVDAAVAATVGAAAAAAGCELYLSQLVVTENGAAEPVYSRRSRRRDDWDEAEDFEAGEVCDRTERLSGGRCHDGGPWTFGELPLAEGELSPPDRLEAATPDEVEFHEATGNAGASFERWYRRAALVLWPAGNRLAVLSQGGLGASLPALDGLITRWQQGGDPGLRQQALDLAQAMLRTWAGATGGQGERMLGLLVRLRDEAGIGIFLGDRVDLGPAELPRVGTMVAALDILPPARAASVLARLVAVAMAYQPGFGAALLAGAVGRGFDPGPGAAALVAGLPGAAGAAPVRGWPRPRAVDATFVVDAMTALTAIDPGLADRVAATMLERPQTYPLDGVVIPAARWLAGRPAAVPRLRDAGLAHLRARIALPLAPPQDWRRDATVSCSCPSCTDLARFLADGQQRTWSFKAAEHGRSHVENTIRHSKVDVDTTTEHKGRPYTLVVTKNTASHDRRVRQRQEDLQALAALNG